MQFRLRGLILKDMKKYKMNFFGSLIGSSGKTYHFDKDEIVEAPQGEFSSSLEYKEAKPKGRPPKEKE